MRIEVCIDVDASDLAVLLALSRQDGMPLDGLIKKAIADYLARRLAAVPPVQPEQTKKEEKG